MARYAFNVFTGTFDLVSGTSSDADILTHEYNSAGYRLSSYNSGSSSHLEDLGPLVVVDNSGDVVKV